MPAFCRVVGYRVQKGGEQERMVLREGGRRKRAWEMWGKRSGTAELEQQVHLLTDPSLHITFTMHNTMAKPYPDKGFKKRYK